MAISILGSIQTVTGNIVASDSIDENHAIVTFENPGSLSRIIQLTGAGPVFGDQSGSHNMNGVNKMCMFPGSVYALFTGLQFSSPNLGDVYARFYFFCNQYPQHAGQLFGLWRLRSY